MSYIILLILLILAVIIFLISKKQKKKQTNNKQLLELLNVKSVQELYNTNLNQTEPSLNTKQIDFNFPWEDVCKCAILEFNQKEIIVDFKSPPETWKNLAGRAGKLFICRKTKKQINFILGYMN